MGQRKELDPAAKLLIEAGQVEQADVARDGKVGELRPGALGQELPGDDVAVVLHLGEQDRIAGFDIL